MLREEDHFLTFCVTKKGELIVGGMTKDNVTLALVPEYPSFSVRLGHKNAGVKIDDALVYLQLFKLINQRYGIFEFRPILCEICLKKLVVVNAILSDGRSVEIDITYETCLIIMQPRKIRPLIVPYRTKEALGDDLTFTNFFVSPETVQILEGRKKFCRHPKG